MIEFLYHDGIQKEIAALERRFHRIRDGLSAFERLCEVQFHPTNPRQVSKAHVKSRAFDK